ncbi:beta-1,4-galactosyltransferase 1-like isoform X2 [Mizuhopecten yessoensis]|uniref:beta-1,4-galactosyltransferase 1-like isoform X2 n=1 Tax=Mizuhopecten yessoensis TaxID=6573 RepID=UPI000B459D2D|nr:beta-1,4-galactosyltransferase 1-like isoform X2 [Mizuhopecten yessoensis]
MYRYIRRWSGGVSVNTFWRRLITVLLCQCVLGFTFIQYQNSEHQTVRDTSLAPRKQAPATLYQNASTDVTPNRNSVNVTSYNNSVNVISNHTKPVLPDCPLVPPDLNGKISVDMTVYSEKELAAKLPLVKNGGTYRPSSCAPRHKVAIIIPYRNRRTHLSILLNNLHPFLQKQQLDYGIFVTELAPQIDFNKALAMNIGFLEAAKKYGYDCFIFHDVDLIPENDNNMYTCPDNPKHMSVAIDKFDYELPYVKLFGGVTAMRKEQFEAVNGYSNKYFGWGAEDDDMYARQTKETLFRQHMS